MSFWFYQPDIPSNFTAAGGIAGLGEIVDAAQKQMELVDNTDASVRALNQAYDERITAINAATGQKLENPMRAAEREMESDVGRINPALAKPQALDLSEGPPRPTPAEREAQKFSLRLQQLQKQYPQFKDAIRADVPIETDAAAIAKQADENLNRLLGSRPGLGGIAASFYGGFKGSLKDPIQDASMLLGAGPGVGRTVLARVANVALKEALINGAAEATMQPTVQAWREKAGLPHGFDEGLSNVMFAAASAGLLGGGVEGIGSGLRRLAGEHLDFAAEHAARNAPLRLDINRALAGDADAAINALKPIRAALAPEARAAIDLHEAASVGRDALPDTASPVVHQANADAAQKVAVDPGAVFEPQLDQAKIDRIVSDLVPDAPAPKKAEQASLQNFLIRAGGVRDQKGELSALGLQNVSERFKGRLVRDNGMALDHARELAAEAGYLNHKYGTAADAVEKSTVADLLEELDNETRRPTDSRPDDGGRSYVEQRVSDLMRQVGPEVDEGLIKRAVERAERAKIELIDAFDIEAELAERQRVSDFDRLSRDLKGEKLKSLDDTSVPEFVYHGTSRGGFDQFDPSMSDYGLMGNGSYFTENPAVALSYTTKGRGDDPKLYMARLSIDPDRVLDMDAAADIDRWRQGFAYLIEEGHLDPENFKPRMTNEQAFRIVEEAVTDMQIPKWEGAETMEEGLRSMGFDALTHIGGARHAASDGTRHRVWIVFDPENVHVVESQGASKVLPDTSAERAADPLMPAGAVAEPDAPNEDEMFTPADLEGLDPLMDIPFFDDGHAATARDIIDDIETIDWLRQITEACRT